MHVQDLPVPIPDPTDCLVRVGSVGLCGSDAHIVSGHTETGHLPITIGHEIAGTVLTAPGGSELQPGDAVFVNPILGCEQCRACARGETNLCPRRRMMGIQVDGGLTQVLTAPARNLTRLPEGADLLAAPLIESAGTAHHALRVAAVSPADVVVVIGLGGLGMQVLRLALGRGARVVGLDLDPVSRQRALEAGATAAVDPTDPETRDALDSLDAGDGCDAVVDCVGFPSTTEAALDLLRPGGRCVVVGIGATAPRLPPPGVFVRRSLTLSAVYAYSAADIAAVVDAVADGTLELGPSVTRVVDLDSVNEAIADIEQRRGSPLRIMVDPWAGTPHSWSCSS
nr:alcohol dehydrogenase catalytic domain-containing protein [Nocardioides sp. IC4_145]